MHLKIAIFVIQTYQHGAFIYTIYSNYWFISNGNNFAYQTHVVLVREHISQNFGGAIQKQVFKNAGGNFNCAGCIGFGED